MHVSLTVKFVYVGDMKFVCVGEIRICRSNSEVHKLLHPQSITHTNF